MKGLARAALCAALLASGAARAQKKRLIGWPKGQASIVIDGRLDEPAWANAPAGTGFVERTPEPGRPAAVRNEVRVLFDEDTLYVGVKMALLEGEKPRALELRRDSFNIFSDDALSLKFDVRHDQRTTVGFAINPAGTQLDYLSLSTGNFRAEYDAVWDAATTTSSTAWIAEFEIPVAALGLPAQQQDRIIGLNVTRDHNARLATYDWSPIPPEFGATSARFYGELRGLEAVGGGAPLTFIPYVLGQYVGGVGLSSNPFENLGGSRFGAKGGGEVRLRFSDDLWGELTILTDFAQVDLDAPQLNLNRFPLFFPERRPFFLSGLDVFDFGASGAAQVLFTRRIGLDDRAAEVPLLAGLKSYGSTGNLRYGVLTVLTGQADQTPTASWSVARARYNFGNFGYVGLISTLKGDVPGLSDPNEEEPLRFDPAYSVGLDGAVRVLDQRLELSGFWSSSINTSLGPDDVGMAGRAELKWLGHALQPSASVLIIDDTFNPVAGFVRRRDFVQTDPQVRWILRTTKYGLARIDMSARAVLQNRLSDGAVIGKSGVISTDVVFRNGITFGGSTQVTEDVVQNEFEVVPGKTVLPGLYRGLLVDYGLGFPGARNPSGTLAYRFNSAFFGGRLHTAIGSLNASLGSLIRLGVRGELSIIDFDDRALSYQGTVNGSVVVTPSTTLSLDLNVQLNTLDQAVGGLLKLRWRYLPGSDLFVVYRERINYARDGPPGERSVALKLVYRYDLVL